MRTVPVTGDGLALDDVVDVARGRAHAVLAPEAAARMAPSRAVVADTVARGAVVYGVTTGFGALADVSVAAADLERMQLALVRSHAAAVALPLVGEGRLRRAGDPDPRGRPAAELLAEEGLEPLVLAPKEGLTLI